MPNYYTCSNGEKVTEVTIKARLSKAYKEFYLFEPLGKCEGCNDVAVCTAHILPRSVCKHLGKTELIWSPNNWFRSCLKCNAIAENVSSTEITKLLNYERIKEVLFKYAPERASKLPE